MSSRSPDSTRADGPDTGLIWLFGNARFDERLLELQVAGEPVEMERKPIEILRHLLRHTGEVVTRDELMDAVWPGRITTDASLAKAVSRVRQALGDSEQSLIRTVHGYGYRLVAEVRVEHPDQPTIPQQPQRFDFQPGMPVAARPQWTLRELLGRGGQGEVWLAEQDKSGEQRVLKFAADAGGLVALKREITLYRFLKETVGPAARCVRLIDWNLETEPFFIESEHIRAGSLPVWVRDQGGWSAVPLARRLELLAQAAEAVAAAHGVGVLHRDLKPGNLLIDQPPGGEPGIRIADFGSGGLIEPAVLDRLGITRLGLTQALASGSDTGTVLYRAPEVLAGQLHTVKADVYALGVMLYQLVIGDSSRPLASGWEADIDDPLLREDIALAAAGNPDLRLADAAELAQRLRTLDLRRARRAEEAARKAGEVLALQVAERTRQENERLKARRFWLRTTVAVLVVGLAASLALYRQAQQARDRALAAIRTADTVTGFFTDDLQAIADNDGVDPKTLSIAQLLGLLAKRAEDRFVDEPEVEARVHLVLATLIDAYDDARPLVFEQIRKAFAGSLALAKQDPVGALHLLGRMDSDIYMLALSPDDLAQLEALLDAIERDHPDLAASDRNTLAALRIQIARDAGNHRGDPDGGLRRLEAVLASRQLDPERRWEALRTQALLLKLVGRAREAVAAYRLLVADPQAVKYAGSEWNLAYIREDLGRLLIEFNELEEADRLISSFAELLKTTVRETSNANITTQSHLALLRLAQGRPDEAVTLLDRNSRIIRKRIPDAADGDVDAYIDVDSLLADALLLTGRNDQALLESGRDVEAMDAALKRPGVHAGTKRFCAVLLRRADALRASGDLPAAKAVLAALPDETFAKEPPKSLLRAERLRVEAGVAQAEGSREEARRKLESARAMLIEVFDAKSWRVQRISARLAALSSPA